MYGRGVGGSEEGERRGGREERREREREGGGEGREREGKEMDKREGEKRGGKSYCMNSPQLNRKVRGAKRMNMPGEAIYYINANLHCTLSFFSRTCCIV